MTIQHIEYLNPKLAKGVAPSVAASMEDAMIAAMASQPRKAIPAGPPVERENEREVRLRRDRVVNFIRKNGPSYTNDVKASLSISDAAARHDLRKLLEAGRIARRATVGGNGQRQWVYFVDSEASA